MGNTQAHTNDAGDVVQGNMGLAPATPSYTLSNERDQAIPRYTWSKHLQQDMDIHTHPLMATLESDDVQSHFSHVETDESLLPGGSGMRMPNIQEPEEEYSLPLQMMEEELWDGSVSDRSGVPRMRTPRRPGSAPSSSRRHLQNQWEDPCVDLDAQAEVVERLLQKYQEHKEAQRQPTAPQTLKVIQPALTPREEAALYKEINDRVKTARAAFARHHPNGVQSFEQRVKEAGIREDDMALFKVLFNKAHHSDAVRRVRDATEGGTFLQPFNGLSQTLWIRKAEGKRLTDKRVKIDRIDINDILSAENPLERATTKQKPQEKFDPHRYKAEEDLLSCSERPKPADIFKKPRKPPQ